MTLSILEFEVDVLLELTKYLDLYTAVCLSQVRPAYICRLRVRPPTVVNIDMFNLPPTEPFLVIVLDIRYRRLPSTGYTFRHHKKQDFS